MNRIQSLSASLPDWNSGLKRKSRLCSRATTCCRDMTNMTHALTGEQIVHDGSHRSPCCGSWPVHTAQVNSGSWSVHNAQTICHSEGKVMTQALTEAMTQAMQLPAEAAGTSSESTMHTLKLSDHLSVLVKPPPGLEKRRSFSKNLQLPCPRCQISCLAKPARRLGTDILSQAKRAPIWSRCCAQRKEPQCSAVSWQV